MGKPVVFVMMPFSDDFFALFKKIEECFGDKYKFINAKNLDNPGNILRDIVIGIWSADVVIADLTGLNPNVFYELGLAHALNKKTIILTQAIDELPFDIKSYRAIGYSTHFEKIDEALNKLEQYLDGAVSGSLKFGTPVSDYLPKSQNGKPLSAEVMSTNSETVSNIELNIKNEESSKRFNTKHAFTSEDGFLDELTRLLESSQLFQKVFSELSTKQNQLNDEMQNATDEINALGRNKDPQAPFYARNICRKISEGVSEYAKYMSVKIVSAEQAWTNIENSMLALLESEYINQRNNRQELEDVMHVFQDLAQQISVTDNAMQKYSDSLCYIRGIERNLTQSVDLLNQELNHYHMFSSTLQSSIERLQTRIALVLNQDVSETE